MRSTKSLRWTSILKRLMPYVSVLPLKSVPGLSVVLALTLGPPCLPQTRSTPPPPLAANCSSWGPLRDPGGWAGTRHLCSPPIWIYHTEVRTGTKYMWLSRSYVFASNSPRPAPREFFLLIWCVLSVSPRPRLTGLESSSASPFMTVK